MSSMEPQVQREGFFAHWDGVTCLVALSFTVKTISTMYLLQALDSLQKNIGEALAVIVIYVSQVTLPCLGKSFELSVFLLAVLVVGLVKTYLISPKVGGAPKAKKQSLHAPAQDMKLVSLNAKGTELMQNIGIDTMRCEVAEALPSGVFYGMLGGVHPVCGNTYPGSPNHCELMLLSHPPVSAGHTASPKGEAAAKAAPFLPSQSLTVLGHVRDPLPRGEVSAGQCMKDVEQARSHLQSRCAAAGGMA